MKTCKADARYTTQQVKELAMRFKADVTICYTIGAVTACHVTLLRYFHRKYIQDEQSFHAVSWYMRCSWAIVVLVF